MHFQIKADDKITTVPLINLEELKPSFEEEPINQIEDEIKDKKDLQKIILCDVQNEIYPKLEKAFLNMLTTSGYPDVKFNKKIDFEKLYIEKFN